MDSFAPFIIDNRVEMACEKDQPLEEVNVKVVSKFKNGKRGSFLQKGNKCYNRSC